MTITVNGPNGVTVNFPDGTDHATIVEVMKQATSLAPSGKPASDAPGSLLAGLEGGAQGITLGTSDEIEGAARALYRKITGDGSKSFGEHYNEAVQIPRARIKAASEQNPIAFHAGEFAGGVAVPGGLARAGIRGPIAAVANRGLGARTLAGGAEGAAYGGAYGAGTAEGGIEDRLAGAGKGAATGAIVGSILPGAVDVAGAIGSRVAAPFRGALVPETFAAEKFGEAVARDLSRDANKSSGAEAQRFADRFQNMQATNDAVRAMDAAGENTRNLMRSAYNMASQGGDKAKRALDARQTGQATRLTENVNDALQPGSKKMNFYDAIDEQVARMDRVGQNMIEPALQLETPMTPKLQRVLDRPTMQDLQKLITRKLADEDKPIGLMTRTEMLHRMKMELDDQIGMAVRAEKMGNKPQAGWDQKTLLTLKHDMLNAMDNDSYKKGLKAYAGQARLKSAAEDGFEHFNTSAPEEIRNTLKSFETDSERIMYRMGAARAIVDKIRAGNANRDRTDGVFSSPEIQLKLKEIIPDQAKFREFQKALIIEAKMADSRKALQGNSTTAKQLMQADQAGKPSRLISAAANAATGRLEPAFNVLTQGLNRFAGITPAVANRLLELGLSKDAGQINALASASIERAARTPVRRAARSESLIAGSNALMGN